MANYYTTVKTVNNSRTILITSEILSFTLLIRRTTFLTAKILSLAFGLTVAAWENVAEKSQYQWKPKKVIITWKTVCTIFIYYFKRIRKKFFRCFFNWWINII